MDEVINVTQCKARKMHYCMDCGRPILPGCEYMHTSGRKNGSFFSAREHIHCDAVINAFMQSTGHEVHYNKLDDVVGWLYENACWNCSENGVCRNRGQDIFRCSRALAAVLDPTILPAALLSVQKHRDAGD